MRVKLDVYPVWNKDGRSQGAVVKKTAEWDDALNHAHPDALVFWDRDMGARGFDDSGEWTVDHSLDVNSDDPPGWLEISVNLPNGAFARFVSGVRDGGMPRWILIRESRGVVSWEYYAYYGNKNHETPFDRNGLYY